MVTRMVLYVVSVFWLAAAGPLQAREADPPSGSDVAEEKDRIRETVDTYFSGIGLSPTRYSVVIHRPRNPRSDSRFNIVIQMDGHYRGWIEGTKLHEKFTPITEEETARHTGALRMLFGEDHQVRVSPARFDHAPDRKKLLKRLKQRRRWKTIFFIIVVPLVLIAVGTLIVLVLIFAFLRFILPRPRQKKSPR